MADPLPDDRLSLSIFDALSDDAGNALDGDLRGDEPGVAANLLPSGDGVPGGDFDARFTMDARPKSARGRAEVSTSTRTATSCSIRKTRTTPTKTSSTRLDFPAMTSLPATFSNGDVADGFDKLAAYGDIGNPGKVLAFRWLVDLDNDGVPDLSVFDPANINGLPLAGNFDGEADNGDEVGVFDGRPGGLTRTVITRSIPASTARFAAIRSWVTLMATTSMIWARTTSRTIVSSSIWPAMDLARPISCLLWFSRRA